MTRPTYWPFSLILTSHHYPGTFFAMETLLHAGTSMRGLAALLAMLNSRVPGIAMVSIDDGFRAGIAAATINRMAP